DRDAYALDGIPARIRPVYLGAPAPERGLASATSEEGAGELVRRAREWAQGIRGLPYVADRARLLEQLADIAERAAHQERDADARRSSYCGDYEYRYVAVHGLERRRVSSRFWERVTPEMLASMTPKELRHVADVMEGGGNAPE